MQDYHHPHVYLLLPVVEEKHEIYLDVGQRVRQSSSVFGLVLILLASLYSSDCSNHIDNAQVFLIKDRVYSFEFVGLRREVDPMLQNNV